MADNQHGEDEYGSAEYGSVATESAGSTTQVTASDLTAKYVAVVPQTSASASSETGVPSAITTANVTASASASSETGVPSAITTANVTASASASSETGVPSAITTANVTGSASATGVVPDSNEIVAIPGNEIDGRRTGISANPIPAGGLAEASATTTNPQIDSRTLGGLRTVVGGQLARASTTSIDADVLDVAPDVLFRSVLSKDIGVSDRFPRVIPFSETTFEDEEHVFRDNGSGITKYVYTIDKAPVVEVTEVTATVGGVTTTLTQGTDYRVIDADGDGKIDSIDFDIGGQEPDLDTTFEVTYRAVPIIARYIGSYDSEFSDLAQKLEVVADSHQIDNANGVGLDQIGALFGPIGKRRGRDDAKYRSFLKSIVQSFKGRGTVDGIRFAVAAGLNLDPSNVTVNEDFVDNSYTIVIEAYDTHTSDTIRRLADLADPSGVEYGDSVTYDVLGDDVLFKVKEGATKTNEATVNYTFIGGERLGSSCLGGDCPDFRSTSEYGATEVGSSEY